jgi:hypothetical protein
MAFPELIRIWMKELRPEIEKYENDPHFIEEMLTNFWPVAKRFELRLSQMRKARAGITFEMIVRIMLGKIGIRCEDVSKNRDDMLKRIDIVIPDKETALRRPDHARFLACKTTLRERYKQIGQERDRGWIIYVLTLDNDIPDRKAREMREQGIYVYVKDEVKAKKHLVDKDWIRKLSELPRDVTV